MPVDMTKARSAVYALRIPGVHPNPELSIDRVITAYTVSDATREHEQGDMVNNTDADIVDGCYVELAIARIITADHNDPRAVY